MNPWLKLAGGIVKGAYLNHRTKARMSASVEDEEQVLRQMSATMLNGIFDRPSGFLALTTRAVRFEKAVTMTGRAASGSVVIPLDSIRSVTVEKILPFGRKVVLGTADGSHEFCFGLLTKAEEVRDLILNARDR